jgi:hypothetical protein
MVDHNTKNSKKQIPFPTYIVWFQSKLVVKTCTSLFTKKCKYTKKWLKWFLVFMKVVVIIKHFDFIWLE